MKVIRRPLELDAQPPSEDNPHWIVTFKNKSWEVEATDMLELYELAALKNEAPRD